MKRKLTLLTMTLVVLALSLSGIGALAQGPQAQGAAVALGTGFTYQGQLKQNGAPVNGVLSIAFRLYDSGAGGTQLGVLTQTVTITNGLLATLLDFGNQFNGDERWLGLKIGADPELTPRLRLSAVPYALRALNANAADRALTATNALNAWSLAGNSGTGANNFIGTSDNMTLTFSVSNTAALRLVPAFDIFGNLIPNVIGGWEGNQVSNNAFGATISGGGASANGDANMVSGAYGTIGGGRGNSAGAPFATVSGGVNNNASKDYAAIGGGAANIASGSYATIGGGSNNNASKDYVAIGGGTFNVASNQYATVGGGESNNAGGTDATVGGGRNNSATNQYATIGGGAVNNAGGYQATIGGGSNNNASGYQATISGGYNNSASGDQDTIGGGYINSASGSNATVGGGNSNTASGNRAFVGGGDSNTASGDSATVGGGNLNSASGNGAFVGGGGTDGTTIRGNQATNGASTVGGGFGNVASGFYATVPGGYRNTASENFTFAAGVFAIANRQGSFVWADNNAFPFFAAGDNHFDVRATGGIKLVTGIDGFGNPNAGVYVVSGGSGWNAISDRNAKMNFAAVDTLAVLKQLASLPIETWNYKSQSPAIRHIGPMAQDFSTFGVGDDDKSINEVDAQGVAFAAIQALYRVVQDRDAEVSGLKSQVASQRAEIDDVKSRLTALEKVSGRNMRADDETIPKSWVLLGGLVALGLVVVQQWRAGASR